MVDILMATYNGEKYIREQLDSILNQTYTNFTLHISDDKSTDSTRKILKEYSKKDKRIILHFQDKNMGYIKNFEYLLTKSTSDYVMFSDQDDVWLENKVEVSLNKIVNDKLDLVITNLFVVDKDLNLINDSYFNSININMNKDFELGNYLLRNPATGCTMIFNRKLVSKLLPFPHLKHPYCVHDWYIYIMGKCYGKVGVIKTPLIKYRQHGNNCIGMHKRNKWTFNFIRTVRAINLDYHIDFCDELLTKIKNKSKDEIIEFRDYLINLRNARWFNLKINYFFRYTKLVGFKFKLRYFIMFHFPFFFMSKPLKKVNNDD